LRHHTWCDWQRVLGATAPRQRGGKCLYQARYQPLLPRQTKKAARGQPHAVHLGPAGGIEPHDGKVMGEQLLAEQKGGSRSRARRRRIAGLCLQLSTLTAVASASARPKPPRRLHQARKQVCQVVGDQARYTLVRAPKPASSAGTS